MFDCIDGSMHLHIDWKAKKDTRLIAWTETINSGSNYIKIYSMANNSVVKTFPGSLIICFDKNTLLYYESK